MKVSKGHFYLVLLVGGFAITLVMIFFGREVTEFLEIGEPGRPFLEAIGKVLFYAGLLLSGNHYLKKIRFFNLEGLVQNVLVFSLFVLLIHQIETASDSFPFLIATTENHLFLYLKTLITSLYGIYAFCLFGRLAFVQKNERELIVWRIFLGLLLFSTFIFFVPFNLPMYVYGTLTAFFIGFSVYFSFSYKWIGLIELKEMRYLFMLFIPLNLIHLLLLANYIFQSDYLFLESSMHPNLFLYGIHAFVITYGFFSMLALMFQMPMQNLREKRSEDIKNIFAIQELIVKRPGVEHIFNYLFDTSADSAKVEAGWIKYKVEDNFKLKTRNINFDLIEKVEAYIQQHQEKTKSEHWVVFNLQDYPATGKEKPPYRSLAYFSLKVQDEKVMEMVLLDSEEGKFDQYVFQVLQTYFNQTKLAYENKHLLEERLSSEVMKNEMDIAKDIQMRMIPADPPQTAYCDFFAITRPANEVGGDFYDYYINQKNELYLLIGDVTGKGLPAAIHMAEVKGIIQTLIQFDFPPDEFMIYLNQAVSACFQKHMFLTLNLIKVDPVLKKITYVRGGHCPMLFYHQLSGEILYLEEKGMGAGIIRNDTYRKYFKVFEQHYQRGDIIALFTDGYVETVNPMTGEEFGYERIALSVKNAEKDTPEKIAKHLNKNVENYAGTKNIDDDLLLVVGKFL